MAEYDNRNTGVLFKNKDKDGSAGTEKFPDYRGNLNINGEEFWLKAWINEARSGEKYMSLRWQPKEPRQAASEQQKRHEFNDGIPF